MKRLRIAHALGPSHGRVLGLIEGTNTAGVSASEVFFR